MIHLTTAAADHFIDYISKQHQYYKGGIAIKVYKNGCSGWSYKLEYNPEIPSVDNTATLYEKGINLFIDREHLGFLEGTTIDYVREGLQEGFKFNNPNVVATCGCGESFTVN